MTDDAIEALWDEVWRINGTTGKQVISFARALLAQEGVPAIEPAVTMRPMESDDGRKGWYIDHPEFFCDIEPDADTGQWAVFFRDKNGKEGYAERAAPPVTRKEPT